jgi:large subunit ribosomal protein L17
MRHKKSINHLGRKSAHRKAMLSNLAISLIMHKRIETTTAKAKALKRYVEPLITRAKDDSTHSRRVAFSYLQDKDAVSELFREVGAKVGDRPGGYTRVIKLGHRLGDNADMCLIELVDFNENLLGEKAAKKKAGSRRRRGARKPAEAPAKGAAAVEAATDAEVLEQVAGESEAAAEESQPEDLSQPKDEGATEATGETEPEATGETEPEATGETEPEAEEQTDDEKKG